MPTHAIVGPRRNNIAGQPHPCINSLIVAHPPVLPHTPLGLRLTGQRAPLGGRGRAGEGRQHGGRLGFGLLQHPY